MAAESTGTGVDSAAATPGGPSIIVGIGASAGGLEALQAFFAAAPAKLGWAYVVVQHLSPDFKSLMTDLLQRHTEMAVLQIDADMPLMPNTVYVLAPGRTVSLDHEQLVVRPRQSSSALEFPISRLFESLAPLGQRAVAVVLSGTGSDGSTGVVPLHRAGGLVVAQRPESARFESMPRAVIATGLASLVGHPSDLPQAIADWLGGAPVSPLVSADEPQQNTAVLQQILALLNATYGVNFELYKPGHLLRRIERRLHQDLGGTTSEAYSARLATDRQELDRLYHDLLIGVTRFFRDANAFTELQDVVLSPMVQAIDGSDELRMWSCGCSTGEEAYSLAIAALDCAERAGRRVRVKVLATDLHGESLRVAALGLYPAEALSGLPPDLVERYFVPHASGLRKVSDDLRRCVIFSAHNVLADAAFTRIDVVTCRNLLIYLRDAAQRRALAAFHFALKPGGVLFLGDSETPNEVPGAYDPLSREHSLYRKAAGVRLPVEMRSQGLQRLGGASVGAQFDVRASRRLDELLLKRYLPTGLLVNDRFELIHVYGDAGRFLHPPAGRFSNELTVLLRAPMRAGVMMALRKASSEEGGDAVSFDVAPDADQPQQVMRIEVDRIADRGLPYPMYMVRMKPVAQLVTQPDGTVQPLRHGEGLAAATHQVEELEAELARVREALQSTVEELESANEELQAGNEELMAANEELQSTNEELHAVNEELYSVNTEHESKINELRETTSDLHNLIRATELAILFLDVEVRLRLFTPLAAQLFPLQASDVGRDLRDFMPREADARLFPDIEQALTEPRLIDYEVTLADGRSLRRRITPYRDAAGRPSGLVLTYLDITEQVKLRAQLLEQQQQALFRALSESMPHLTWTCNAAGDCDYLGPQWEAYTGIPAATQLRQGWLEQVHPDDREALIAQWQLSVATGALFRVRFRIRRHDGTYRWFATQAAPMRDDGGSIIGWVGSNTDIQDLMDAQHRMSEREALLRAVADNMGGATAYWDAAYRNLFSNRVYARWHAQDPAQILGRPMSELVGAEIWALNRPLLDRALAGERQVFERDVDMPDGQHRHLQVHYHPVEVDGHNQGVVATLHDVTPLHESGRRLEVLLDNLPVAVLVVAHDGRILRANTAAEQLTGWDADQLLQARVEDLLPLSARKRHTMQRAHYQSAPEVRSMRQTQGQAFSLLRADQTTIEVDVMLAPGEHQGQPAVVAVVQDMRPLRLQQGSDHARAETARSSFLASMSHEIRTPLNAIMGMSQLLQLEKPTAKQADRLKRIEEASEHLLGIVNDVLDLAQIETGHFAATRGEFGLAELIDRALAMVSDRAALKRLDLRQTIDPSVPARLLGDARRIEQVLINYLSNAVKFTPGGSVHVQASVREASADALMLRVEVHDTGIGIAEIDLPKLFKPFQQVEQGSTRRFGGTGLGLAISRQLAVAMGGDCGVNSAAGAGSSFWFTVRVERVGRAAPAPQPRARTHDAHRERIRAARVLVVEDNAINRAIAEELLQGLGVEQLEVAETGEEALAACARQPFDLVLMDMHMPGMDGLEATRRIRQLPGGDKLTIVALTGNVLPDDVKRCQDAGMNQHLPKPLSLDSLSTLLLQVLPAGAGQAAASAPAE